MSPTAKGSREPAISWFPNERILLEEAIARYTEDAASIRNAHIALTMMDGRIVYEG